MELGRSTDIPFSQEEKQNHISRLREEGLSELADALEAFRGHDMPLYAREQILGGRALEWSNEGDPGQIRGSITFVHLQ